MGCFVLYEYITTAKLIIFFQTYKKFVRFLISLRGIEQVLWEILLFSARFWLKKIIFLLIRWLQVSNGSFGVTSLCLIAPFGWLVAKKISLTRGILENKCSLCSMFMEKRLNKSGSTSVRIMQICSLAPSVVLGRLANIWREAVG